MTRPARLPWAQRASKPASIRTSPNLGPPRSDTGPRRPECTRTGFQEETRDWSWKFEAWFAILVGMLTSSLGQGVTAQWGHPGPSPLARTNPAITERRRASHGQAAWLGFRPRLAVRASRSGMALIAGSAAEHRAPSNPPVSRGAGTVPWRQACASPAACRGCEMRGLRKSRSGADHSTFCGCQERAEPSAVPG